jgi:hypothetical protein
MELVSVVRILHERRVLVGLGALVALLAGLAALGRLPVGPSAAPTQVTSTARTRLMVDMPKPLAADLEANADTIGPQAALLADLMAAAPQAHEIARTAGVAPGQLAVLRPSLIAPAAPSPLGTRAAAASTALPRSHVVSIEASTLLPIVEIDTFAPDARAAARLATATTATLKELAAVRARSTSPGLVVKPLEPIRTKPVVSGGPPNPALGLFAAFMTFVLWCLALVLASGLGRAWRRAAAPMPDPAG